MSDNQQPQQEEPYKVPEHELKKKVEQDYEWQRENDRNRVVREMIRTEMRGS